MARSRYNLIPAPIWPYLGPAFKGIDQDLSALESSGVGGTGGGGIITSGPYTLDPKRAPDGTVVLIPAGTTVLTHIGNRFTGQASGTRPNADTLTLSGSLIPSAVADVNWSYADTGYFGESVRLITPATATDIAAVTANIAAGVKDMQLSYMLTYPAPTSDVTILGVYRTGGALTGAVAMKPGSTGGTFNLIYDDPKTAGSWNYTSPDVPTGTRIRIAIAVSIGTTGTDGRIKFLAYRVADDGTETQIGTMYEVTGQSFASTDVLTRVNVGKLTGKASMESATINIESMRIAYGVGAYDIGLLRSEQSYPAAI